MYITIDEFDEFTMKDNRDMHFVVVAVYFILSSLLYLAFSASRPTVYYYKEKAATYISF